MPIAEGGALEKVMGLIFENACIFYRC